MLLFTQLPCIMQSLRMTCEATCIMLPCTGGQTSSGQLHLWRSYHRPGALKCGMNHPQNLGSGARTLLA